MSRRRRKGAVRVWSVALQEKVPRSFARGWWTGEEVRGMVLVCCRDKDGGEKVKTPEPMGAARSENDDHTETTDTNSPRIPFSHRVLAAGGILIALTLLVIFLWYAVQVLLLLFAGILFAILLRGLADWVAGRTGLSSGWSLAVVLVGLAGLLVLAGLFLAPQINAQVTELTEKLPQAFESIKQQIQEKPWGKWFVKNAPSLDDLGSSNPEMLKRAGGAVSSTLWGLVALGIVIFVGIYLAADPDLYTSGVLRLVPIPYRERAREVLAAETYTLRWWLIGQFVAMSAVGVLTGLGLWLLGVPLSLALGLLAFLFDFVPNIGPFIAAAPGILLAFTESPDKAVQVMILYIVVQQIEGMILTPLVQQRTVLLPPVLTISAQLLLGILVGPLGVLLATPLIAAVLVLVKMLYVEDALGDRIETPETQLRPEDMPPLPKPEPKGEKPDSEPV